MKEKALPPGVTVRWPGGVGRLAGRVGFVARCREQTRVQSGLWGSALNCCLSLVCLPFSLSSVKHSDGGGEEKSAALAPLAVQCLVDLLRVFFLGKTQQ